LDYLEQVKKRFEDNKEVYGKFLDIMKDFQSRILETSGVIRRVSELFKGERNLIMGFNAFLPEGYKITEAMYQNELQRQREKAQAVQARTSLRSSKRAAPPPRAIQPSAAAAANSKKPPELEYAKNYVSKIRKRFKHSPKTYQQFLNILQNYQEEQKTVKEVYEQVQRLFQGHNDLLEEFARFLPDPDAPAVPEPLPRNVKPSRNIARKPPRRGSKDEGEPPQVRRDKPRFFSGPGYKDEMEFFKQLKSRMPQTQWEDFLKLLNMFNQNIVNAMELKVMTRDLFQKPQRICNQNAKRRANDPDPGSETPDLYEGVMKFLGMLCGSTTIFDGKKAAPKELHRPSPDHLAGPSYLCRPQTNLWVCSGRLDPGWEWVDSVCNDQFGLNPLGSEQSAVLTNTHEMALFRAEDERYELDVMIGRTTMAMRQLEAVAHELSTLTRAEKQAFEVNEKVGMLPMRQIQKIYGEHGNEMIDTLYENPAAAVPIVLARIKQKDLEFRTVRHQQNRLWQEVFEQNYHKALDHRSYAFKVQDKKALHTKTILQALRDQVGGITVEYGIPLQDTQLWSVLKTRIAEEVDQEEVAVMTAWWEGWLTPFLGSEVMGGDFGTPGKDTGRSRRTATKDVASGEYKVLYVNHTMATVLRLHQMLHNRMIEATRMATDEMNEAGPSTENQMLGPGTPRDSAGLSLSPQYERTAIANRRQNPFQTFISDLLSMLRGTLDLNKYEDECRTLLGTSSYKLFTLDKLIPRLIKETNNLCTSEGWHRIRAAWNASNGISEESVKMEPLTREQYRQRMSEEFGTNCFEVRYDPAAHGMTIAPVPLDEYVEAPSPIVARRNKPAKTERKSIIEEAVRQETAAEQAEGNGTHQEAAPDTDGGADAGTGGEEEQAGEGVKEEDEAMCNDEAESEQDKDHGAEDEDPSDVAPGDGTEEDDIHLSQDEQIIRRPTLNVGNEAAPEDSDESDN